MSATLDNEKQDGKTHVKPYEGSIQAEDDEPEVVSPTRVGDSHRRRLSNDSGRVFTPGLL